jgi:hypothetical protein
MKTAKAELLDHSESEFHPMPAFTHNISGNIRLWSGHPNCQAAHDSIIAWLKERNIAFRETASLTDNILRGNIGETITFYIALHNGYEPCHAYPANALRPFNPNSAIDFDIAWVYFGDNAKDDWAALQEVKTTSGKDLSYANALIPDYEKLFGTNIRLTLQTRLQDIQARLEFGSKRRDLGNRVFRLAGNTPQTSSRVRLLPTMVHEKVGTAPDQKMLAVRETLIGMGWSEVEAWAIGLSDLDQRLVRIATGKS